MNLNRADFTTKVLDVTLVELKRLNETKGQEYSGSDNVHANFDRLAEQLTLTPEKVLWVYAAKHLAAITSFCTTLTTHSTEPIEGRIDDAILYLLLLKGMQLRKRGGSQEHIRLPGPEFQP